MYSTRTRTQGVTHLPLWMSLGPTQANVCDAVIRRAVWRSKKTRMDNLGAGKTRSV